MPLLVLSWLIIHCPSKSLTWAIAHIPDSRSSSSISSSHGDFFFHYDSLGRRLIWLSRCLGHALNLTVADLQRSHQSPGLILRGIVLTDLRGQVSKSHPPRTMSLQ